MEKVEHTILDPIDFDFEEEEDSFPVTISDLDEDFEEEEPLTNEESYGFLYILYNKDTGKILHTYTDIYDAFNHILSKIINPARIDKNLPPLNPPTEEIISLWEKICALADHIYITFVLCNYNSTNRPIVAWIVHNKTPTLLYPYGIFEKAFLSNELAKNYFNNKISKLYNKWENDNTSKEFKIHKVDID